MVSEATKAPCGNQGSPQPGSPRSHGASRQGITAHIVTSKQRTTKPCRNESGQTFFFKKSIFCFLYCGRSRSQARSVREAVKQSAKRKKTEPTKAKQTQNK